MRNLKLFFSTYCCIMSLFVSSCSEHGDCLQEIEQNSKDMAKTCSMKFDVTLQDFDSSSVTRSNSDWKEGDKIYLTLGDSAYGTAEFTSGSWVLNYSGDLSADESGLCTAYYFENIESESTSVVNLNYNTSLYKAIDGNYSYDGTTVYLTANLKPIVGRIRFSGTPDSIISVIGITRYSSYSIVKDTLTSVFSPITLTVQSDGYTPYIYGYFTSQETPRLNILTGESGFNRKCPTSIFKTGESGWMDIPTLKSYNGWIKNLYFEVDSVGFTMIPVKYNSSIFYLAETELTEALYAVVNQYSAPTYPNRPHSIKYSLGYSDQTNSCSSFISKLNQITNIKFRLPTKDEWQFAAKGGELSQGYTYSGSNTIAEVAWYDSNSDGEVHDVAQLMPNELGFYDMSGNLWEWTSTGTGYNSYYYYSIKLEFLFHKFLQFLIFLQSIYLFLHYNTKSFICHYFL